MSSLAYGVLTRKREEATPETSKTTEPPGVKTYIDALAALVPAEVLTTLAVLLPEFTKDTKAAGADDSTLTVTNVGALRISFWGLLAISAILFVIGRHFSGANRPKFEGWDVVRPLIPAAAFVGWVMLQQPLIFRVAVADLSDGVRRVIAILGGVALGAVASLLAIKADHQPPAENVPLVVKGDHQPPVDEGNNDG